MKNLGPSVLLPEKDTSPRMSAIEEIGTFSPSHSTGGIFLFEADRSTFRSIWC